MKYVTKTFAQSAVCSALVVLTLPNFVHAQNCVAGVRASNPSAAYVIDAVKGTVVDTRTALMWDQCPYGLSDGACATGTIGGFTWQEALLNVVAANTASYKGYSDWRVPNVKELRSLAEECRGEPSINESVFPAAPPAVFWSSTPSVDSPDNAWGVFAGNGASNSFARIATHRVRLVRAGL